MREIVTDDQDEEYFRSYADISIHEEMLSDRIRTNTYRLAILKNYEAIRGKSVIDVGAGTGILSIFCVHAGARKVYAIEASDLAFETQKIIFENKMNSRIDVIKNKVEDVRFAEKMDVIVSEWMGYGLLYESMLPSVIHTRDRWLKEDGVIFPSVATLYMAPFTDEEYEERINFWKEMKDIYKVSMESIIPHAKRCTTKFVHVKTVDPEAIQSHSHVVCKLCLKTVTIKDLHNIKSDFEFKCFGQNNIHGFLLWFTVDFPGNISLSTSPYSQETHWAQTCVYVNEPFLVEQDTSIKGSISLSPNSQKPRFLDINLSYSVDDKQTFHQYYFMNDCIT